MVVGQKLVFWKPIIHFILYKLKKHDLDYWIMITYILFKFNLTRTLFIYNILK